MSVTSPSLPPSAPKPRLNGRNASREAFEQDLDRISGALHTHRIPDQERCDLAQDILLAALEAEPTYDAAVATRERWLNGIILNHIGRFRARRREILSLDDGEEPGDTNPVRKNAEEILMSEEVHRLLNQFLDELPAHQLDVILAYHIEDLTFQEIATALGKPLSTVHDRYQAGIRALRAAFQRWEAKQRESGALLLPITLESLLELERKAPHPTLPPEDVERLWRRYQQALGGPGSERAPASGPRRINLPRRIKLFVMLPAIGYLLVGQCKAAAPLDRAPAALVQAEVPATTSTTAGSSGSVAPGSGSADPIKPAAPSAAIPALHPQTTAPAGPRRRMDSDVLSAERATLEKARSALILTNMQGTMAALVEHAQKYPGGVYARERDELWIEALVRMGRTAEACQRVGAFRRAYPKSPLPAPIDALCAGR